MFADRKHFLDAIKEITPNDFISLFLFESIPFLFSDIKQYTEWKNIITEELELDNADIKITGSAALGFSLNPEKKFRKFNKDSDVDIAMISPHFFDIAWRFMRDIKPSVYYKLNGRARYDIKCHREKYIYWGTIATDKILEYLPFGRIFNNVIEKLKLNEPTKNMTINFRIYRDYTSLRLYQKNNLEKIQSNLF